MCFIDLLSYGMPRNFFLPVWKAYNEQEYSINTNYRYINLTCVFINTSYIYKNTGCIYRICIEENEFMKVCRIVSPNERHKGWRQYFYM